MANLKRDRATQCSALILGLGMTVTAIAPTQALTPKARWIPEVVLQMDLDFDRPGLETISQSETRLPTPKSCQGSTPSGQKITEDVMVKYEIAAAGLPQPTLMFHHLIGTNLAVNWVSKISEVRHLNNDGRVDLVFYTGDDTAEEVVLLLMKPDHVKAVYAGTNDLGRRPNRLGIPGIQYQREKPVSEWDPEREVFIGKGIAWTNRDCVPIYRAPNAQGPAIRVLRGYEVVTPIATQGNWQKVTWYDQTGWIERRYLSKESPTRVFSFK